MRRPSRNRLQLTQNTDYLRRLCPKAAAVISLDLQTLNGLPVGTIGLDRLRFFLDGDPGLMALLYELLLMGTVQVRVTDGTESSAHAVTLPPSALTPVGFAADDGLLDYDNRSFVGYRLLSEYFAFPDKFLFIDLAGLDHPHLQHAGHTLSLHFFLRQYPDSERHNRLAQTLGAGHFKLGCTPAINLFKHAADPIRISHHQTTYPVLDDARAWAAHFVQWYNIDHRHSGIRYVSPAQRHAGEDHAILAARHTLYTKARELTPARWSGNTRNWSPIDAVTLNPERDCGVKSHSAGLSIQPLAA